MTRQKLQQASRSRARGRSARANRTLTCEQCQQALCGTLPASSGEDLLAHLRDCPECQGAFRRQMAWRVFAAVWPKWSRSGSAAPRVPRRRRPAALGVGKCRTQTWSITLAPAVIERLLSQCQYGVNRKIVDALATIQAQPGQRSDGPVPVFRRRRVFSVHEKALAWLHVRLSAPTQELGLESCAAALSETVQQCLQAGSGTQESVPLRPGTSKGRGTIVETGMGKGIRGAAVSRGEAAATLARLWEIRGLLRRCRLLRPKGTPAALQRRIARFEQAALRSLARQADERQRWRCWQTVQAVAEYLRLQMPAEVLDPDLPVRLPLWTVSRRIELDGEFQQRLRDELGVPLEPPWKWQVMRRQVIRVVWALRGPRVPWPGPSHEPS